MDYYRYRGNLPGAETPNMIGGVHDLSRNVNKTVDVSDLIAINTQFNNYTSTTSQSTVSAYLDTKGAKVWAWPKYGNAFEQMFHVSTLGAGIDDDTEAGKYTRDFFSTTGNYPIKPSAFPGCTPGCIWYAMSIWRGGTGANRLIGTCYVNFRQMPATTGSSGPGLRDIFYPARQQFIEAYVIYGNGSNRPGHQEYYNDPDSATLFSSDAQINTGGYNTDFSHSGGGAGFSHNDGMWGYGEGSTLDGQKSSHINSYTNASFGYGNLKSTDTSSSIIYFGKRPNNLHSGTGFKMLLWTMFN